jgi:isochorismate hydrolase
MCSTTRATLLYHDHTKVFLNHFSTQEKNQLIKNIFLMKIRTKKLAIFKKDQQHQQIGRHIIIGSNR